MDFPDGGSGADGHIKERRGNAAGEWRRAAMDPGWKGPSMNISRRVCGLVRSTGAAGLAFGLAAGLVGAVLTAPLGQSRASAAVAAVVNTQTAVSWGFDGLGELGDGTTNNRSLFGAVDAGSGIVQVAAGLDHGLAVTSSGTVYAWGSNTGGQLGNGTTTLQTVPVQVKALTGVVAVAAGYFHSLALRSDGTVWAWGDNTDGELGTGTTARSLVPVRVKGLSGITAIAAGEDFSLARRSDGTVWAWGINADGELGNGTTTNSLVPVQVRGLSQVTSIAAGGFAAYAIRTTSTGATSAWAWGGNGGGELGDGTTADHHTPEQVTGIAAPGIASIAAGWVYALALGTDGSVWGWGNDANGELGNAPTSTAALRPVQTRLPGSGIVQLAASSELIAALFTGRVFLHTLALRSDGTVWAWGDNSDGQLGDGSTGGSTGPVEVAGLAGVTQVAAGSEFSFALTTFVRVPSVVGDTTSAASSALQAAGFYLGQVTDVADYTCNYIGVIKSQTPTAGTWAKYDSPVSVTVGTRPPQPCN
jgi:alpha-tubulin suppressor-like RCC1 family protein